MPVPRMAATGVGHLAATDGGPYRYPFATFMDSASRARRISGPMSEAPPSPRKKWGLDQEARARASRRFVEWLGDCMQVSFRLRAFADDLDLCRLSVFA